MNFSNLSRIAFSLFVLTFLGCSQPEESEPVTPEQHQGAAQHYGGLGAGEDPTAGGGGHGAAHGGGGHGN